MTAKRTVHAAAIAAVLLLPGWATAQTCDDFNECTANDMCSEGMCSGSFQSGGCDDGNPCTLGDTCMMDPETGSFCLGLNPAPVGTECGGGCGTCQPLAPVPGAPVQCVGDPANAGDPCDAEFETPCFEGACQFFGPLNFTVCIPEFKECPDTDGNPCTDRCNFESGECDVSIGDCVPFCETCNASTGACEPANVGAACDDFIECTAESHCETLDDVQRTLCMEGPATGPSPTPTVVPGGHCVGDCDPNEVVEVNELIIGVNIALDFTDVSECPAFDTNSSGEVEVNELIGAVNNLLGGCPA